MKKKAFTLVELLVVIAIIAILATAGIVGYTVFTEKARKSNAESELNQVKTLLEAEDFENAAFEIANGVVTFNGYYCITNVTIDTVDYEEGAYVTNETYATFTEEQKAKFGQSLELIAKNSEDTELKSIADKLTYNDGEIIMTSTSNSKYEAVWNLAKGSVTGRKK